MLTGQAITDSEVVGFAAACVVDVFAFGVLVAAIYALGDPYSEVVASMLGDSLIALRAGVRGAAPSPECGRAGSGGPSPRGVRALGPLMLSSTARPTPVCCAGTASKLWDYPSRVAGAAAAVLGA